MTSGMYYDLEIWRQDGYQIVVSSNCTGNSVTVWIKLDREPAIYASGATILDAISAVKEKPL